jgi:hypothetical protein
MYNQLTKTLQETKMSNEKRKFIKDYCNKLKAEEVIYRNDMLEVFNYFFKNKEKELSTAFENIAISIKKGESIQEGLTQFGDAFNLKLAFSSKDERDRNLQICHSNIITYFSPISRNFFYFYHNFRLITLPTSA